MTRDKLNHFCCERCGRLTSVPWDAAWCLHSSRDMQPQPPSHSESDWTRMSMVVRVETEPVASPEWVLVEYQNPSGWRHRPEHDSPRLPGEPPEEGEEWTRLIRSEPMPEMKARRRADHFNETRRRKGWPRHMHGWEAIPVDLATKYSLEMA